MSLSHIRNQVTHMIISRLNPADALFAMVDLSCDRVNLRMLDSFQLVVSISQYDLDLQTECRLRGEQLDCRYAELWMQERAFVAELDQNGNAASCDIINDRLDLIRYEMTVIQDQLDNDYPCSDDTD